MDSEYILEPRAVELTDILDGKGKKKSRERYLLGYSID